MNRIALTFSTLATMTGCYTWQHAPGHDQRAVMTKQRVTPVAGSFCISGVCDKQGPRGRLRFSDVDFVATNDRRTRTRFTLDYDGVRARCQQRADREAPFACTLAAPNEPPYRIALARGCTSGDVHTPTGLVASIQTDAVEIAGQTGPGREVALVDADGVIAHADARAADMLEVYTRQGATLTSAQLVTLAAVQAFVQLDGTAACGE